MGGVGGVPVLEWVVLVVGVEVRRQEVLTNSGVEALSLLSVGREHGGEEGTEG